MEAAAQAAIPPPNEQKVKDIKAEIYDISVEVSDLQKMIQQKMQIVQQKEEELAKLNGSR
jgi:peptidoglycan hydrolase CwlO-like protein